MERRKENRIVRKRSQRKNSLRVSARAGQILASNIYGQSFNQGPQASFKVFTPFFIHSLKKFTSWTWFIMIRSLCKICSAVSFNIWEESDICEGNGNGSAAVGFRITEISPQMSSSWFQSRTINSTGIRNSKPFIIFHWMRQLLKQNPFSKLHWITWALKSYSRLRRNSMQWHFFLDKVNGILQKVREGSSWTYSTQTHTLIHF